MNHHDPLATGRFNLPRSAILLLTCLATTLLLGVGFRDRPGLTVDEPINTGHGKRMVHALVWEVGQTPTSNLIDRLYRTGHEHPPLARFLIGLAHALFDPDPNSPDIMDPKGGRLASMVAFVVLVGLVTWEASHWAGGLAGVMAGLATLFLPRLFGHALLASPEVISGAFLFAALMACGRWMDQFARPRFPLRWILGTGVMIGLAMLTKLTAVLVPATLVLVALGSVGLRAIVPLLLTGLVSLVVFVGGWPWLWPIDLPGYAPGWRGSFDRLIEFFRVGVDRATIYVDYFGTQYPHESAGVPWHYAWVFFGITIPVATLLLGLIGWGRLALPKRARPASFVWLLFPILSLGLFSLPIIARYDGERLFLFVFPVWSLFAGLGASITWGSPWVRMAWPVIALAGLVPPAVAMQHLYPACLSYFNEAIGRLPGAERRGLELTYWGDSITDELLNKIDDQGPVILVPTLYDGHAMMMTTPALAKRRVIIEPLNEETARRARWAIVFRRAGYLHDKSTQSILTKGEVVAEVSREGVWLTRLYRLDPTLADRLVPAEH
jgi:hypothetical protein